MFKSVESSSLSGHEWRLPLLSLCSPSALPPSLPPSLCFHNPLHHQHHDCRHRAFYEPNSFSFQRGNSQDPELALYLFSLFYFAEHTLTSVLPCFAERSDSCLFDSADHIVVKAWKGVFDNFCTSWFQVPPFDLGLFLKMISLSGEEAELWAKRGDLGRFKCCKCTWNLTLMLQR